MRRPLQVFIALLALIPLFGFASYPQNSVTALELLDLLGRPASRITDGDTVRIRLTMAAPPASPQSYIFKLDNLDNELGSCSVSGGAACQTDPLLSLGWHWDTGGARVPSRVLQAFDPSGNLVARSAPIQVAPRPVVLVHGFVSSWETWKPYLGPSGYLASLGLKGFAVGDGQVPGTMNVGSLSDPTALTNTLAQNAAVEEQYIAAVKKATGAQMVDVVGHSMGGMISRYYIDRLMQARDVAQLVMLGSPMGGSDCSVLPAALGFYLPASIEIRQSYMESVFNRQITHRHGIQFYDLAGTAITKPFQSPCAAVPNDLAVSIKSVNAIPLQSSSLDLLHSNLTSSPDAFRDFVMPLLQKPPGSFAPADDPAAPAEASAPLPFTRVYTGHVDPGGSVDLAINVEPNLTVASFALYDATRSVAVSVRGASGNVLKLDPQANGFIQVKDPSSLVYLGYGFSNPKPGIWHVTVLATDATPVAGADFAVSVYFIGGSTLDARASTLIPKLGETVHFTATVVLAGQPLEITHAQVVLRGPGGTPEKLALAPGASASVDWTPHSPGTYAADITVSALGPDGSPVERTAFLAEEVQPNPDRLQVTANLMILLVVVLLVLGLLIMLVIWLSRRLLRPRRQRGL